MNAYEFRQKQSLPYEAKVILAEQRALEFDIAMEGNTYISVGGLDSITLLFFLRSIGLDYIPAISVSCLEGKSIQAIHKQIGVQSLRPLKTQDQVVKEFGYPIMTSWTTSRTLSNPTKSGVRPIGRTVATA